MGEFIGENDGVGVGESVTIAGVGALVMVGEVA